MHQSIDDTSPNVRFVRLNTGEDLVTELIKVQHNEQEYYQFVNPLKVLYLTGKNPGSLMLSFIEWVFPKIVPKQEFQVFPDDIVTIGECSEELIDYYFEALYKFSQSQDKVGIGSKFSKEESYDESNDYDDLTEIQPTEEELEYIKKVLDDLKNGKGKLH